MNIYIYSHIYIYICIRQNAQPKQSNLLLCTINLSTNNPIPPINVTWNIH